MPILTAVLILALTVLLIVILLSIVVSSKDSSVPDGLADPARSTTALSTPKINGDVTDTDTDHSTAQTTTAVTPETTATPTMPSTTTKKPEETTVPAPSFDYLIDISEFEDAIDPTGELWSDAYLLLVNADHMLADNAENDNDFLKVRSQFSSCTDYKFEQDADAYLNSVALKALAAMFLEVEMRGIATLDQTSAYRSYSYQSNLFNNNCDKTMHWLCECGHDWIHKNSKCTLCGKTATETLLITREEQEASVVTYSCAPGTSEHQTGLTVDIILRGVDSLSESFGETDAGKWLAENAHKFGFVLRFPKDKEDITGIIYEPWHFRYVGRTHATAMYEMGLCLEEYIEHLNSTGYFN